MGRNGISDLACDVGLIAEKHEVIGEAHEACGFPMRDGSVFSRMQIPTLLRLKELSANRDGGSIPPQAPEEVRSTGRLSDPTIGGDFWGVALEIKAIAA